MVATGRANDSSATTSTTSGSTILAQVSAAGPRVAVPAISSSSDVSALRTGARLSSLCPTSRTLRTVVTALSPRCHDPAGGHPGLPLIGQLHLVPIGVLTENLELSPVGHLVDHAGGD